MDLITRVNGQLVSISEVSGLFYVEIMASKENFICTSEAELVRNLDFYTKKSIERFNYENK